MRKPADAIQADPHEPQATPPRSGRAPVLAGVGAALLFAVACGGGDEAERPDPLSTQEAMAIANDTFACQMIDAAASGMEVDVRELDPPIPVRVGENPIRITMGVQADMIGRETMETDPDTYYRDYGLHITYPGLPEGSQDGITQMDGEDHAMVYVDGQMSGEREFEVSWRFGMGSTPALSDVVIVAVPCGSGTMTVTPGGANVFEQAPAPPDASAYVVE